MTPTGMMGVFFFHKFMQDCSSNCSNLVIFDADS